MTYFGNRGLSELSLLKRLLSAWRETRAPALEPQIDKAGWAVAYGRGTIRDEAKWHEVADAADAGDVDRLLDAAWPREPALALARIAKLAKLPPDPRISLKLAGAARAYVTEDSRELHRAIAALLVRAPSARLLPAIDAIEAARGHMTHAIYADTRRLIAVAAPATPDASLVEAATERFGDGSDLAALFARIVEHPDDLAHRAVLADHLQQAGDPRGDFIALQLAEQTPAIRRRAAKLLEVHGDTWSGPLPGMRRQTRRFERGFLVAAHLELHPEHLARAIDRPEWATIEELSVAGTAGDVTADVAALVARMPLLRCFAGPSWAVAALAKAGGCRSLQTLVVFDERVDIDRVAFPRLEVLLEVDDYADRALARRAEHAADLGLRAFGFVGSSPSRVARLGKAPPIELRFAFGSSLDRHLPLSGWQLQITADRSLATLGFGAGRRGRNDIGELVERLRREVVTIEICEATASIRGALRGVPDVRYVDRTLDLLR